MAAGSEWAGTQCLPEPRRKERAEQGAREANHLLVPEPGSMLGSLGSRICHLQGLALESRWWGARHSVPVTGTKIVRNLQRRNQPQRRGLQCAEGSTAASGWLCRAGLKRLLIQTRIASEKLEITANCFPVFAPQ